MHIDGEGNGVHDTAKLHQRAVAHELDDAPVVLGGLGLDKLSSNCLERLKLVERYAEAMEAFTRIEPLPRTDFFIARGRALAAFGRGSRDDKTMQELKRLRDEGERVGLKTALPALDEALAAG